jgi:UDP-3-O-[3-hydroxymyristoyl] N-acetylglucosamine deacetylase
MGSVRLMTVEHLLAALWLKGLWSNLLIEVEGPEIPILDGSAQPWVEALEGWPIQPTPPQPVPNFLRLLADKSSVQAEPADTFSLLVTVAFPHPRIGYQRFDSSSQPLALLASARTFGFMEEAEAMRAKGLALGASLDNALVFGQTSYLNEPRFTNEPVLHKALDFLGDLYLVGVPLAGRFVVHRGSHQLHVELVRRLEAMVGSG